MMERKKVDLLGHAALVALAALFAVGLNRNAVRPFLKASKDLSSFREAVRILSDAQGNVDRLDAEIQSLARQAADTETLLPASPDLDAFLEQIDLLARTSGVRVERLTPDKLTDRDAFRELDLELQVTGPFLSIYELLSRLEHGGRLLRIEEFRIQADSALGRCAADVRIALCFARENKV